MSNLPGEVFVCGKARKEHLPPYIGVSSIEDEEKQSLNLVQVQPVACKLPARLLGTYHTYRIRSIDESNTWKSSLDQQVTTGGSR